MVKYIGWILAALFTGIAVWMLAIAFAGAQPPRFPDFNFYSPKWALAAGIIFMIAASISFGAASRKGNREETWTGFFALIPILLIHFGIISLIFAAVVAGQGGSEAAADGVLDGFEVWGTIGFFSLVAGIAGAATAFADNASTKDKK